MLIHINIRKEGMCHAMYLHICMNRFLSNGMFLFTMLVTTLVHALLPSSSSSLSLPLSPTVHGGIVELRDWSQLTPLSSRYKSRPWKKEESHLLYKTKLCWFYDHHPQGCPRLLSDQCPYAHGMKELRERPDFKTLETSLN